MISDTSDAIQNHYQSSERFPPDINSLEMGEFQNSQNKSHVVDEGGGLAEISLSGPIRSGSRELQDTLGGSLDDESIADRPLENQSELDLKFFEFTGRTSVWKESLKYLKSSPLIGFGFHADRIIFDTHAHNSLIQALIQTGILGTVLFVGGVGLGWVLLIRLIRIRHRLSESQFHSIMMISGVMAFLTVRAFPESTGAFFGIDWLILAPMLMFIHQAHNRYFDSSTLFNTKYVARLFKK